MSRVGRIPAKVSGLPSVPLGALCYVRSRFGDSTARVEETQPLYDKMKIDVNDLITQQEAADLRGVSIQAINKLVKRGRLQTVTIGKRAFLLKSEVQAFLSSPGKANKKAGKKRVSK